MEHLDTSVTTIHSFLSGNDGDNSELECAGERIDRQAPKCQQTDRDALDCSNRAVFLVIGLPIQQRWVNHAARGRRAQISSELTVVWCTWTTWAVMRIVKQTAEQIQGEEIMTGLEEQDFEYRNRTSSTENEDKIERHQQEQNVVRRLREQNVEDERGPLRKTTKRSQRGTMKGLVDRGLKKQEGRQAPARGRDNVERSNAKFPTRSHLEKATKKWSWGNGFAWANASAFDSLESRFAVGWETRLLSLCENEVGESGEGEDGESGVTHASNLLPRRRFKFPASRASRGGHAQDEEPIGATVGTQDVRECSAHAVRKFPRSNRLRPSLNCELNSVLLVGVLAAFGAPEAEIDRGTPSSGNSDMLWSNPARPNFRAPSESRASFL
ncbi:hypothetical protein B0H13DRAFT_1879413 [Mycena leptocephala]|nr:hypothetical protein B0H13DRAFT_1879413 [Mycena leptocephala]